MRKEILKYKPRKILDYGAGKCKIANSLAYEFDVSVYDIDLDTLKQRAIKEVKIIETFNDREKEFDLIICNLVLCCITEKTADGVIKEIYKLLISKGKAIISVCNPYFNEIHHTELKTKGNELGYKDNNVFKKLTSYGYRDEYHRAFTFYEKLFYKNGLKILNVLESDGINCENLEPVSEHLFFVVEKRIFHKLSDCSLLIKCNLMNCESIENDVNHIVTQIERGI